MKVAGFGFRKGASEAALADALAKAGGSDGLDALASLAGKADNAALKALAERLALPVIAIDSGTLSAQITLTQSARILAMHGTGSVAEAAALAACGPGARLLGPRHSSADRMATAAIAISGEPS